MRGLKVWRSTSLYEVSELEESVTTGEVTSWEDEESSLIDEPGAISGERLGLHQQKWMLIYYWEFIWL